MKCTFRVSVIGVGKVGATAAYAMLLHGTPTDLVLFAHHKDKAEAERLDLEHALPFLQHINIIATDQYSDVAGSDFIIITAGVAQQPGQTRLDLLKQNLAVFSEIIPQLYAASPESTFLVVTNPVDILTYHSSKLAPFRFGQLFGSGTLLDTARFRFHLSELFQVNPRSIHAYVLGEHGDHSFPVLSSAHIGGQLLTQLPNYSQESVMKAFTETQQAAYKIIAAKGATYYAIGTVIMKVMQMIYSDAKTIAPVSIPLTNIAGQSDIALSIPCVIGHRGIEQVIPVPFSPEEQTLFAAAADVLRTAYTQAL